MSIKEVGSKRPEAEMYVELPLSWDFVSQGGEIAGVSNQCVGIKGAESEELNKEALADFHNL